MKLEELIQRAAEDERIFENSRSQERLNQPDQVHQAHQEGNEDQPNELASQEIPTIEMTAEF